MDLDAYAVAHRAEWDRLAELAGRRRLTGPEADELIEGYQAGAAQLSALTTAAGHTPQSARLGLALARARLRFTGASGSLLATVPAFFVRQLPAALYRLRWITLAVAAATILVAVLFAVWANADPRVFALLGQNADLKQVADSQFVDYYSDNPAASFTGQVWTNNAWIAAQCIAFGIVGVYVPYLVLSNATNIGVDAAIMFDYGKGDVFFSYIVPHGLLELTSVFVAAAAGLRIFWAWVAPGPRSRTRALAEAGRSLVTVAIGLACSLFVSGIIEGFVTPSPLPVWAKIAIGSLALAAFLSYMLLLGGRAARLGETGDLAAADREAVRPVAG